MDKKHRATSCSVFPALTYAPNLFCGFKYMFKKNPMYVFFLVLWLEVVIIALLIDKVCANIVLFFLSRAEIWIMDLSKALFLRMFLATSQF